MDLAEWVRKAREYKGITQEELGELMSVSKANVSHWENGRHEPSFGQVMKMADLTGYSVAPLMLTGEPPPRTWPLPGVDRERLEKLPEEDRKYIGSVAAVALEMREREREAAPKTKRRRRGA